MAARRVATVEALLGVSDKAGSACLGVACLISRGLLVSAVDRLADAVAPDDARFKFRLISKATLGRRTKSLRAVLTCDEGNRLAKVYLFAFDIYRDNARAREFLDRPNAMLDGKSPLDVALATDPGADAVINLLGSAVYSGGV